MRNVSLLIGCIALAGCATIKEMEKKGFSTEFLLEAEKANWGQRQGVWDWPTRANQMGIPVEARPIAIREIRCRRDAGLYDCDYLIDYGRDGKTEGSYQMRHELIGTDNNGKWSIGWIVVT